MHLAALATLGIKISITLTVCGIGLSAGPDAATSLFRAPSRLLQSLLAMVFIVPLFTVIVARTFELTPAVVIALCALSVSPVPPPLWPRRALKPGGDDQYTIGLLVATTVLSIVIIPLALAMFELVFSIPLFVGPRAIASVAVFTVLLPLAAGMAIRRWRWQFARRIEKPIGMTATILLLVSLLPVLVTAWPEMATLVGDGTLLTMLAFVLVGLLAGHVLGGPSEEDSTVLALASAARHPGMAMTIASLNFPNEKLVPAAILLYLMVCGAATTAYLMWSKRHARRSGKPLMALR